MINRVLIRVKVVQMLYSYLLTRSEFKIDEAPESASRDRRYAYVAYINLLLLILELSGLSAKNGMHPHLKNADERLGQNKVGNALSSTDAIRSAILRDNSDIEAFFPILSDLHAKIVSSAVFEDYRNKGRKTELADDVALWVTILETIIARDPAVEKALRTNAAFTVAGYQMAVMDVVKTLKSYNDSRQLLVKAQKDLQVSLDKAYELYLGLLKLVVDLTDLHVERLNAAKNKYITTSDDLNPNMRLANNALAQYLRTDDQFCDLIKDYKVNLLSPTSNTGRVLLDKILASDIYEKYLAAPATDFNADVEFWRTVMHAIILPSDALAEELEDRSVYWNDDIAIMGTFALKTIRRIAQAGGKHVDILNKYKDNEDARFGCDLFMAAVNNFETYRQYVDMNIDANNWDAERTAFMDIVILVTAIAEIIRYPLIPLLVSINEYVEIANNYSTERSGAFVNGILGSVAKYLYGQGIIAKTLDSKQNKK